MNAPAADGKSFAEFSDCSAELNSERCTFESTPPIAGYFLLVQKYIFVYCPNITSIMKILAVVSYTLNL